MSKAIHRRLQEIERMHHDGVSDEELIEKIDEAAKLIVSFDGHHPLREACEVFAPSLWGGASCETIDPEAIQAALSGPDRSIYLRAWSGIGRAILANRLAA